MDRRKTRGMTFLSKLVLYGSILGIVPLLALGFFSYYRASGTIQSYVEEGNLQILKLNQSKMEQNLKAVETSVTSTLHSPFVESVLTLPLEGRYFNEFYELVGSVRQLQVFELGVNQIQFFNMKQKWKIDNDGIYPFGELNQPPEIASFLDTSLNTVWQPYEGGIRMITKKPSYTAKPDIVFMAEIPFSHLRKLLLDTSPLGSVFVTDGRLQLLGYQDEQLAKAFLEQTALSDQLSRMESDNGQLNFKFGGQDYAVTYIQSGINGWIYLSAVSIDEITHESNSIRVFTFWLCLVIILLVLAVSVFSSNRMYSPIRKLYATVVGPDVGRERTGGYGRLDELQQISAGFLSLMDRQQAMSGQIHGQLVQLNQFFVQKLFFGEMGSREIEEKLQQLQFPLYWQNMCVMAVEIDTLTGTRYQKKDLDLLLFAVSNIVGELAPPNHRLHPIVLQECQFTILGADGKDSGWDRDIYRLAEELQQAVRIYLGITVSVGISNEFGDWLAVPKAYREAANALRSRVKLGDEAIISVRDILADASSEASYPVKLSDELRQAIQASDLEKANGLLRQMIDDLLRQPFHDYQFSLVRFLSELGGLLQDQGIPFRMLMKDEESVVESLFQLKTSEEVEAWFAETVMEPVMRLLDERRRNQFRSISEAVIGMIEEGYDTDLSLEICADKIDYHPHYVSKVFRQETGVSFGDYLLQYRLKVAKRLLAETDMKISEISDRLKYTTSTNFIRSFRKVEGETPGQYRERMLRNQV